MTAEEKIEIKELSKAINEFKLTVTKALAVIDTTLKSYPEVKHQVYENKESISKVKMIWSTIVGLAFLVQVVIVIISTNGGTP